MKLIYIAGPFRSRTPLGVRWNVEAARDLGLIVAIAGDGLAYPVIPHTMTAEFDQQMWDDYWLEGTMEMLKRCDAMVLTANWRISSGAVAEWQWMIDNRRPIYEMPEPTPGDLRTWLRAL